MEDIKIYTYCGHFDKNHFRADEKDCNVGDVECLACGFLSKVISLKTNEDITHLYKHGINTK
jgi:hypothetical protein